MQKNPLFRIWIIIVLAIGFLASSCSITEFQTAPGSSKAVLRTAAEETISVELTLSAGMTAVAQLTKLAQTTPTELPTISPIVIPTMQPQLTASAPPVSLPSPTLELPTPTIELPTPTIRTTPCGWAQFIEDVTAPVGTNFTPESEFTKTWRIRNIGLCTWTEEFDLVFIDGNQMNGLDSIPLMGDVLPGETVDISVDLTAPENLGRYRGEWKLRTDTGVHFGTGQDADDPLSVEIRVYDPDKYAFDFGARFCEAEWRSDAGRLPCPGEPDNQGGFVILVDNPVIEIERIENEAALWMHPAMEVNGFISGNYPDFEVPPDARFRTVVGCMSDSPRCDVIFQLNYQIGDGDERTLWELSEVYDDVFTNVAVNLSPLAGQKVHFILTVLADGSPNDDNAFWLVPRIVD